jgi:carbon storage regulator
MRVVSAVVAPNPNPLQKESVMLVLSRKKLERLVITGPCVITLVDVRGDKARLGIEADPDTGIMREELLAREGLEAERSLLADLTGRGVRAPAA